MATYLRNGRFSAFPSFRIRRFAATGLGGDGPVTTGALVERWRKRLRLRRHLLRLSRDPWLLEDIGLSPEQAEIEIGKPFWRA